MIKIYVQKKMFIFMNIMSLFILGFGIIGAFTIDKSMFYLLFVSLGFSILSLMFLINKIYYNDEKIRFACIYKKETVRYEDIKEIFIEYDLIVGGKVIFNLENCIDGDFNYYMEYVKRCKNLNIKNTVFLGGISKKDLKKLLVYCKCKIKGNYDQKRSWYIWLRNLC